MPLEFTSVTASSYDAAGLANKLTDKSAEGWDVVSLVNTGTEIAAILSRTSSAAASTVGTSADPADTSSSSTSTYAPAAAAAASEPAGWGSTSTASPASSSTPAAAAAAADPSSGYSAASQPSTATAAAAASSSTVPAGWYADPAGRFDLRYWDGNTWTEHVSRAGQQFTDPPVA